MYIHCSWLFVALMISWLTLASCSINSSYNLLSDQRTKSCPSDGIPVCGLRDKQRVLFSNDCLFNTANKDRWPGESNFRRIPLQNCMQGCKFSCPKTYKPVCTRNQQTYRKHLFRNQCELIRRICKNNVDYQEISLYECLSKTQPKEFSKTVDKRADASEKRRRPVPCTNVFKPVCGSYLGVKSSFKNECLLNAENVAFNRDWRIVKNGMCPEDFLKTRRRKDKPAEPHSIKKRSFDNVLLEQYSAVTDDHQARMVNKNELDSSPNDLYLYMVSTFDDEFLNHETSRYHQPLQETAVNNNEYLEKIAAFTPIDLSYTQTEETEETFSEESVINPLPFALDRLNSDYLINKNLAHEINQQSSPYADIMEPVNDEQQKLIYYAFKTIEETNMENEYSDKISTKAETSVKTTKMAEASTAATIKSKSLSKPKQIKREKKLEPKIKCKFDSDVVCAALTNGTTRTFETICDMMTENVNLKQKWTRLHNGPCENCKYNCSTDYAPVCISRNGVNYTMINECYYNMGICLDKMSKWQMLSNKECDRYTRIPDKYSDSKQGFPQTSSYNAAEATQMPGTDSELQASSDKKLRVKPNKKHKGNAKREISSDVRGSDDCCSRSNLSNKFSEDILKCKCWSDTMQEPVSRLPLQESQTESFIMRLVKEKGKSIGAI